MKFCIVVLLLSCISFATCFECTWTGCEGITKSGRDLCEQYGYGHYTGIVDKSNCKWDSEKVQCCVMAPLRPECRWTSLCYGLNYGHGYVCNKEFGSDYKPSRKLGCSGLGMTAYECCPEMEMSHADADTIIE